MHDDSRRGADEREYGPIPVSRDESPDNDTGDEDERYDTDALGPCGCVDYHYADCPLVTDRFSPPEENDPYDFEPEGWY